MAYTLDDTQLYQKQYVAQFFVAAQQKQAKLRGTTRTDGMIVGSTFQVPKINAMSTSTWARGAAYANTEGGEDTVVGTIRDKTARFDLFDQDLRKFTPDLQAQKAAALNYALNRDYDKIVIADALTGTSNTISSGSVGMTQAKIMQVLYTFAGANVPTEDGGITLVVGAQQWTDMLQFGLTLAAATYTTPGNTATVVGADYGGANSIVKPRQNFTYAGMNVIMSTLLSKSGNDRLCYAYHRDFISVGDQGGNRTQLNKAIDHEGWIGLGSLSMGAVRLDSAGVIQIACTE